MKSTPVPSLLLCALALALHALPQSVQAVLIFDRAAIASGQYSGLVSGHWIHVGQEHLVWNVTALAVLGSLVEQHSRRLLLIAIAAGTLAVDLNLLLPTTQLQRYCGLSGVLNTLMGTVLYLQWRQSRSFAVVIVAVLWACKIAVEISSGQAIVTNTSWPPFATAHLAGMLATPLVFAISRLTLPSPGPIKKEAWL